MNPQYSDLEIKCGDRTWPVHKSIVCLRSSYFAKACDGRFKEANEGCVDLHEDDANAVHALLEYLYTTNYNDEVFKEQDEYTPLSFNVLVFFIADKYEIPALATLACNKFFLHATSDWRSASFCDAAEEIYETSTIVKQQLRDQVIRICKYMAQKSAGMSNAQPTYSCGGVESDFSIASICQYAGICRL
jgi:hypothetical protein